MYFTVLAALLAYTPWLVLIESDRINEVDSVDAGAEPEELANRELPGEDQPEERLEVLDQLIARPIDRDDPQAAAQAARWRVLRGRLLLESFELPGRALGDFEQAAQLDASNVEAVIGAFQSRLQLSNREGKPFQVDTDFLMGTPYRGDEEAQFEGAGLLSPSIVWPATVLVWLALCVIYFWIGEEVLRESRGSVRPLAWVAGGLAALAVLPLIVAASLVTWSTATIETLGVAACSTVLAAMIAANGVKRPVRLRGTAAQLPVLSDPAFLDRLAGLCRKMGVTISQVRLWPSISGGQQALAFAGTLHAPQLVVTDGILSRLSTAESDAIVAHELAPFANWSLWGLIAVTPLSCALATAATAQLSVSVAIPYGCLLAVGIQRVVSRIAEYDCDRRAGEVVGYEPAASAIAKIHAVHPVRNTGLLSRLVYATATHPSRDARVGALLARAPGATTLPRPAPETLKWHAAGAWVALAVWGVLVAAPIVLSLADRETEWLGFPLGVAACVPMILLLLAQARGLRLAQRRHGNRWILSGSIWGLIAALGLITAGTRGLSHPVALISEIAFGSLCAGFLLCLLLVLRQRALASRNQLRHRVAVAFQVHDFQQVLKLCRDEPKLVRKDPVLRYNEALAEAICGDRSRAIESLERLWAERPAFALSGLLLGELLLDADRLTDALAVALGVERRLPGDVAATVLVSRALCLLGRNAEAQQASSRALQLDRDFAACWGVESKLALEAGDIGRARELVARGLDLSPGDPFLLIVEAGVAMTELSAADASDRVAHCPSAASANPLAFLAAEIRWLEDRLVRLAGPRGSSVSD